MTTSSPLERNCEAHFLLQQVKSKHERLRLFYIELFYFDGSKRTNKMIFCFDLLQKLYVNICIFENHYLLGTNGINMN
jgi:hypothetical protein